MAMFLCRHAPQRSQRRPELSGTSWSTTIILAALRQLLWPLGVWCNCRLQLSFLRLSPLCFTGPVARQVELQDDRVMHDPVYRGSRRHRVAKIFSHSEKTRFEVMPSERRS